MVTLVKIIKLNSCQFQATSSTKLSVQRSGPLAPPPSTSFTLTRRSRVGLNNRRRVRNQNLCPNHSRHQHLSLNQRRNRALHLNRARHHNQTRHHNRARCRSQTRHHSQGVHCWQKRPCHKALRLHNRRQRLVHSQHRLHQSVPWLNQENSKHQQQLLRTIRANYRKPVSNLNTAQHWVVSWPLYLLD